MANNDVNGDVPKCGKVTPTYYAILIQHFKEQSEKFYCDFLKCAPILSSVFVS